MRVDLHLVRRDLGWLPRQAGPQDLQAADQTGHPGRDGAPGCGCTGDLRDACEKLAQRQVLSTEDETIAHCGSLESPQMSAHDIVDVSQAPAPLSASDQSGQTLLQVTDEHLSDEVPLGAWTRAVKYARVERDDRKSIRGRLACQTLRLALGVGIGISGL